VIYPSSADATAGVTAARPINRQGSDLLREVRRVFADPAEQRRSARVAPRLLADLIHVGNGEGPALAWPRVVGADSQLSEAEAPASLTPAIASGAKR